MGEVSTLNVAFRPITPHLCKLADIPFKPSMLASLADHRNTLKWTISGPATTDIIPLPQYRKVVSDNFMKMS